MGKGEALLMRVGIGYDIHRLKAGRKLFLGGVLIPHPKGLLGHSDGDVLLHAVTDAVLGAMAAGDIGDHFSDKEAKWKSASSAKFVVPILELLKKKRMRIHNVDTVLIMENPKLQPYKLAIKRSVATIFKISEDHVSIKAKTNEGLDSTGKGQAIACHAVVLIGKI